MPYLPHSHHQRIHGHPPRGTASPPVPRLARWMLALGILASLAVNVAQGWSHGLVGAVVAAWPAVSLVGSYELLAWIIRTAATGGPDHIPASDRYPPTMDHARTGPWPGPADAGPVRRYGQVIDLAPVTEDNPQSPVPEAVADPRISAGLGAPDHPDHPARTADSPDHPDQVLGSPPAAGTSGGEIDAAAVAAYRASVQDGQPLSERKLAEMFGRTSRRWARNRMAESRQSPAPV
jgi:hypothetical protein